MRDGYIIPKDCYGEVERVAYDGIDVMIGSNADEMRYFISNMEVILYLV